MKLPGCMARFALFAAGLSMTLAIVPASAQVPAFPSRVIRITSPFPIGLAVDVTVRMIAEKLSRSLGQQVLVEARPGANGFIAIGAVKKAPADGHELLVMANAHLTINPHLIKSIPYDPVNDFVPVSLISRAPFFIVASANGPYKSLQDLVAAARASPGRISYSSPNVGSAPHLGGALLAYLTGTQMTAVHFKDSGPMLTSVVNGDVSFIVSTSGSSAPLIKAGKLRYLAAAAPVRLDLEPEVPSAKEAGGPADYEVQTWTGIVAPRGTPADIVQRLGIEIGRALAEPEVRERFRILGFQAVSSTSAEMAALTRQELPRFGDLVKRIGITAE